MIKNKPVTNKSGLCGGRSLENCLTAQLFAGYMKITRNSLILITVQNFASIGSAILEISYQFNDNVEVFCLSWGIFPPIPSINTPLEMQFKT